MGYPLPPTRSWAAVASMANQTPSKQDPFVPGRVFPWTDATKRKLRALFGTSFFVMGAVLIACFLAGTKVLSGTPVSIDEPRYRLFAALWVAMPPLYFWLEFQLLYPSGEHEQEIFRHSQGLNRNF